MKKLNVAKKDACMACKACEIACSEAFYKKFDEDLSCIKISVQKDGKARNQLYAYSAENAQKSVRRVPSLRIQRAYT